MLMLPALCYRCEGVIPGYTIMINVPLVFAIAILVLFLLVGFLAWRVYLLEGWIKSVINQGYRKDRNESK